jgi:beta-lactamase regulating signal transducer with metallopeptidase domain
MGTVMEVGLDNALVVLLAAAVVAGFGRVCRRPALVHTLWVLVLFRLLAPPLFKRVSVPILWLGESSANGAAPFWWQIGWFFESHVRSSLDTICGGPGRLIVGGLWMAGTAAWLAHWGWQVCRFRSFLAAAQPASIEIQNRAGELGRRLGLARAPGVWLVPSTVAPMVWAAGVGARVILPAKLWNQLDAPQQDALLLHELAHVRRRDHWVRLLEAAATALYWWHPAVWWARHGLHETEEECCDAWVVASLPRAARSYATALLSTVDFLSEVPTPLPVGATGLGQSSHFRHLHRRLNLIMRRRQPKPLTASGLFAVLLLSIVTLPISIVGASVRSPGTGGEREFRWYAVSGEAGEPGHQIFVYQIRDSASGEPRE